ncbi:hypothetical protein PROFUN_13251 [Planoprotostelium fungivorum]|uniref:Uncharacterized protein n=1 Tax=Planoprotostelium fungivorum TaxID=1890364 RepID=A0A2P6N4X6_9EUKA|nr:hypothetical protein PROFUN_13251 [Planoprotostelium fungivorum]
MLTAIHGSQHCYFNDFQDTSVKGSSRSGKPMFAEMPRDQFIQSVRTMNKYPLYTLRQRMSSRVYLVSSLIPWKERIEPQSAEQHLFVTRGSILVGDTEEETSNFSVVSLSVYLSTDQSQIVMVYTHPAEISLLDEIFVSYAKHNAGLIRTDCHLVSNSRQRYHTETTQFNMRSLVLFCFIICLSTASAGVLKWNTTLPGCSASSGYIDFNTAACWNGGGMAPSVRDTAIISLNTFSFGISISSDISLARLTIRDSLVSSIFLSSGKLIFNTPTANPSSLIAAIGSTVSILSSSLSLSSLRFVNASLDVSSLSQFTLDCPSVSLERSFTILAPTTPIQITWLFDSMLINGNITETHAVHHVYTSNTNATITTKNYPLSSSGPLYLWNSQSTVHFSSLEYLLQAPQVILAETVSFDGSSSLTLNETSSGTLPTIDASSSSLNLSTVVFGIQDVFPYYQINSTLVIAKTLNADPSKVIVQPSNGDTSCQGPADVMVVNGQSLVLYLAAYAVKPVQDFKVVRGNTPDLVNVTFTPIVDSCVQNVKYTVSDDSHNSNYLGQFVGSTPVSVQLTDTTTGIHVYSLNFDYDMKTGYKTNGGSRALILLWSSWPWLCCFDLVRASVDLPALDSAAAMK